MARLKLTPAQRELLSRMAGGAPITYSRQYDNAWSSDGRYTVKVRVTTMDALFVKGLIWPTFEDEKTIRYGISERGRAALSDLEERQT